MTRSLESLFERYRSRGDVSALAKVFDRTAPELLRIAMHLVRNPSVAEDLLQETFLAAMENAQRYDRRRRLVPWLAGILSNQARRHRRTEARHPDPERLPPRGVASEPGELEAGVARAIDALPRRYRQIVLLKLGFGMEPAAIAHLLDMPPATLRTRLHRGLETLRKQLPGGLALGLFPPLVHLRGIGTIREVVLSHASTTAVTTAAVSTSALGVLGGIVVTKGKLTCALVLVGLALAGGVLMKQDWGSSSTTPAEAPAPLIAEAEQGPTLHVRNDARTATPGEAGTVEGDAAAEDAADVEAHVWQASGHVVEAEGKRVPGARIEAWVERGSVVTRLPDGEADAEGRYRVDLKTIESWTSLQRAAATLKVRARAAGFQPGRPTTFELVEHADVHAPEGDVRLERGFAVEGRVLDARGEPVEGATVALHRVPYDGPDWYAYTDARGRYAVGTETAGAYAVAVRSSKGTGRSAARRIATGDVVKLPDVVLSESRSIQGRVLAADGSGLPGLMLYAHAVPLTAGTKPPREASKHQLMARTDARGGFRLFGLWNGRYRIGPSGISSDASPVAAMGDHDVVIRIPHPILLTRVIDADGRPLPGAEVGYIGWRGKHVGLVDRVRDGSIALTTARAMSHASSYKKLLAADGTSLQFVEPNTRWIVSARIVGAVPAETTVHIGAGEAVTRLDLIIREALPHGRLDLRVLKPDGTQLDDFAVSLRTPLGTGIGTPWTDANGRLPPVEAGPQHLLVLPYGRDSMLARRMGLGTFLLPERGSVVVPPGGRAEVTIKLREGGRFRLRLTYPEGEQPATDSLRLRIFERRDDQAPLQYGGDWVYDEERGLHVTSTFHAKEACLNARLLAPGDYRLEVRTEKHGTHEHLIRIRAGEITDVVMDLRE